MKEISPKELQKLNDKSFKSTQKIFRRRLREIAAGGENKAKYKPGEYCCGDRVANWLKSLGFTVKQVSPIWCEITWPEEEDTFERLRVPVKFTRGEKIERETLGVWTKDTNQWDYVCSTCGKHSEYATDFCCNCGKKMMNDKE